MMTPEVVVRVEVGVIVMVATMVVTMTTLATTATIVSRSAGSTTPRWGRLNRRKTLCGVSRALAGVRSGTAVPPLLG